MRAHVMLRQWVAAALVLGACGSGGGDKDVTARTGASTITSPPTEIVPYCNATITFDIALFDAISVVGRTPPAEVPAVAQELGARLAPLAAAVLTEVPDDAKAQMQALAGAIDMMAANGDISGLQSAEAAQANSELNVFNSDNCGWPLILLVTKGGPFTGVPQQLGPGFHVFRIRNDDDQPHQVELYREEPDNPRRPLEERLPTGRVLEPQRVTLAASSVIQPNTEATLLVDLVLGEYAFVLADPTATFGRVRSFVPGTVDAFPVVEGG